jgi:transcriptional regulator with GAF, ATPase, and Fis domain
MEEFQDVLLSVWQEACRHIEISESTKNITAVLVRYIPIEQVLVWRVDSARSCLETAAVGLITAKARKSPIPAGDAMPALDALLAWCRQGKVAHRRKGHVPGTGWATVVPHGFHGDVLIGPLGDPNGHCGLLVFLAPDEGVFERQHVELVQLLLEPFSVALENDLRLREMAALREAAEADKRSLLTRLGRKALGDTIVGVESGLRPVMDRVELVARSDAPVLIFGETGTGKELVARAIHNRSPRCHGPFDRVNCGAIPPELIDSQLFGHERGAFTGAVESRRGWFERADGGTLFLDEIGELPLAAQVRMLRILQDGWMERVGGEQAIHVDVRMIAATHRDLAAMVAEGRFRQDLWYRIAVFPIVLPPLRERREDIARLAEHFAERAATRFGLALALPTAEDMARLTAYSWPGNVRELATVIDRAAILGNGKCLEVAKSLGVDTGASAVPYGIGPSPPEPRPNGIVDPLEVVIRRHIESALAATHGCIEGRHGAASLLRVNPHTLRARMRKLGIDWTCFRDTHP